MQRILSRECLVAILIRDPARRTQSVEEVIEKNTFSSRFILQVEHLQGIGTR